MRLHQALAYMGGVLLVLTSGLHSTAFPQVKHIATQDSTPQFIQMFFEALWIFPSLNWLIIALLSFYLTRKADRASLKVLAFIALIPLADALALFIFTGPFIGGFALIAAGGCLLTAATLGLRAWPEKSS